MGSARVTGCELTVLADVEHRRVRSRGQAAGTGFVCVVTRGPTLLPMRGNIELDPKDWDILSRLQRGDRLRGVEGGQCWEPQFEAAGVSGRTDPVDV